MKKSLFAIAAIAALAAPQFAAAQDAGTILVRARAVHLDSANSNDAKLKATLTSVTGVPTTAEINNKWLPEVDISYFFSPNLAAELILTYPQKQTLSLDANGTKVDIGTFKHLPPTLTVQYHFTGLPMGLRPYVGAGLNYTNISAVKWGATGKALALNLKRNSFGLAAQIGADLPLGDGWLVNFDVKKVQIKTDVLSNETKIGTFKVDPLLVSLGVGKTF